MIKVILLAATLMSGVSCKDKAVTTDGSKKTKIAAAASEAVTVKVNDGQDLAKDAMETTAEKVTEEQLIKEAKAVEKIPAETKPAPTKKVENTKPAKKVKTNTETNIPTTKPVVKSTPTKVDKAAEVVTKVKEDVTKPVTRPSSKQVKEDKPDKPEVKEKAAGAPTHKAFDALLSQFVSQSGVVDYAGFKSQTAELNAYLKELDVMTPQPSWPEKAKLAYWINAYNAFTIKLILDNYPVKSITDLHGGKPWDKKWITLGDKTYSLNNIENDIIRPQFKEPRIHFAVNCAAKSCPPLANKAFTHKNMEQLLDAQTRAFVNNSKYNTLAETELTLSKIFEWYAVDFGNVATFIGQHTSDKISPAAKVSYNEYDWALNGK